MRAQAGRTCVLAMSALAATLALAAAPAAAHPEAAAPSLRPDVLRAGHEPAVVPPHTQWRGFLELDAATNVTAAYYQVCRVGQACFAPPTRAERSEPANPAGAPSVLFGFDTADYLANDGPVDYEPGWRVGVTWILDERLADGTVRTVRFPEGPDLASPACHGDAALPCSEAHYLAFDIAAEERGSPAPPLPHLLLAVAAALGWSAARRSPGR